MLVDESSRVCLQPIRGVDGSDYINANFIDVSVSRWSLNNKLIGRYSSVNVCLCVIFTVHE